MIPPLRILRSLDACIIHLTQQEDGVVESRCLDPPQSHSLGERIACLRPAELQITLHVTVSHREHFIPPLAADLKCMLVADVESEANRSELAVPKFVLNIGSNAAHSAEIARQAPNDRETRAGVAALQTKLAGGIVWSTSRARCPDSNSECRQRPKCNNILGVMECRSQTVRSRYGNPARGSANRETAGRRVRCAECPIDATRRGELRGRREVVIQLDRGK